MSPAATATVRADRETVGGRKAERRYAAHSSCSRDPCGPGGGGRGGHSAALALQGARASIDPSAGLFVSTAGLGGAGGPAVGAPGGDGADGEETEILEL